MLPQIEIEDLMMLPWSKIVDEICIDEFLDNHVRLNPEDELKNTIVFLINCPNQKENISR